MRALRKEGHRKADCRKLKRELEDAKRIGGGCPRPQPHTANALSEPAAEPGAHVVSSLTTYATSEIGSTMDQSMSAATGSTKIGKMGL